MNNYHINDLNRIIKSDSSPVVLYGAGTLGQLAFYALNELNIPVYCFCDSDKRRQGRLYCGIKIISPEELSILPSDAHIFLCNNYLSFIIPQLEKMNFKNIYDCVELLKNTDFLKADLGMPFLTVSRQIALHESSCLKTAAARENLNLKYLDVVITERCSLKCRDCSNLMQYYAKPINCDSKLLLDSVDKLMKCIDKLNEFRVLGGEPFMNNELSKIINKLVTYQNADKVVIYTNGTIIPSGENLSCLKHKKVMLEITNYGSLSRNFDKLVKILKENNIEYVVNDIRTTLWNDCATIKYQKRTVKEITDMFMNCCVNDIISLLHGKLYRCPIAAHATNLQAIPYDSDDIVDLTDNTAADELKRKIISFYKDKCYVSACYYCRGRTNNGNQIKPAVQTKRPLSFAV